MGEPVDEPVIKGSFASPESIAHIMTQKFVMGCLACQKSAPPAGALLYFL